MNRWRASSGKGFTLIELLVVLAVIGLLAGVILGSLNSARKKGRDAALVVSMKEFEKLMQFEFNDTGSYAALQPNAWFATGAGCSASFSGNYATQARAICADIVSKASGWWNGGSYLFYAGNSVSLSTRYSMMISLNANDRYLCTGTSGRSETTDTSGWSGVGCYGNP